MIDSESARPRIVILGGGFGGAYCAQALGRTLRGIDADVLLIDRHNYFIFYPLLVEAGTGSLEPRHTVVPIRDFVPRGSKRANRFLMAQVSGVDFTKQTVTCRLGEDLPDRMERWDHLVIALGSQSKMPPIPGLREHALEMKSLTDAVALRDRAVELLEYASAINDVEQRRALLRFVVIGGNFTGVEVAGEFDEFMRSASRQYETLERADCSMMLLELTDRILAPLGEGLSDFALRTLRRRGIDVRLETTVREVAADHVILTTGERVPTRTVIWCAGIEPSALIAKFDLPKDERGYLICDRDLRVHGCANVWAIGDAAVNRDADGDPYPATAQHAVRQGAHLARNLAAVLRGNETTPCDLKSLGSIAAIGCRTGVARVFGIKLSGFGAWWLWRTVYLLKMPRWSRRIRIALDWTLNLLFRRDYVQLGVHVRRSQTRQ